MIAEKIKQVFENVQISLRERFGKYATLSTMLNLCLAFSILALLAFLGYLLVIRAIAFFSDNTAIALIVAMIVIAIVNFIFGGEKTQESGGNRTKLKNAYQFLCEKLRPTLKIMAKGFDFIVPNSDVEIQAFPQWTFWNFSDLPIFHFKIYTTNVIDDDFDTSFFKSSLEKRIKHLAVKGELDDILFYSKLFNALPELIVYDVVAEDNFLLISLLFPNDSYLDARENKNSGNIHLHDISDDEDY
jgi:uncharacterized membrane protein YqjE